MKAYEIQDGLFRIEAETSEENFVVASIHDLVCRDEDCDDDVANDHGLLEGDLNYCTVPAMDVAWMRD